MKRYQLFLSVFVSLALLGLPGCRGPEGPPGPGNAEVFSHEVNFRMADAQVNGPVASVQYDVPGITRTVVDEGAVLVFFREQNTWTAMPFTYGYDNPDVEAVDYIVTLGFGYDVGFLEVFYELSVYSVDPRTEPDRRLKIVIIESFPIGKMPIDVTDYEQVKRYFGLPD